MMTARSRRCPCGALPGGLHKETCPVVSGQVYIDTGRKPKTYRPLFKVGDHVGFAEHMAHRYVAPSGMRVDDALVVVDRAVKQRARDPRMNRYLVENHAGKRGWFNEDDLEHAR